jgi:hypothetical protein
MYSRPHIRIRLSLIVILLILVQGAFGILGCSNTENGGTSTGGTQTNGENDVNAVEEIHDGIDLSNLEVDTLDQAFGFDEALHRMSQIREALDSFKALTNKAARSLTKDELSSVGNTEWEIQALGFHNWPNAVEGTLRKQDYQIKKLEFELARLEYKDGRITKEDMDTKKIEYENSRDGLQQFIDGFRYAD